MIYREFAKVISNKEIAKGIYKAILFSPNISKFSRPGQFINILPTKNWNNVMRRPMSIASQNNNEISIIYKVFGLGTELISNWKKNNIVDIVGPLGNFWKNYKDAIPILIGGGVGIAPIINLHNKFLSDSKNHYLIMGARQKEEHFINHNPEKNIYLTTDNDDYGIKGNVIDALKRILKKENKDKIKIFTCGPPMMMYSVLQFSKKEKLDCDLALETIMACGVGICQGCTIERTIKDCDNTYRNKFALACIDGPIFNIQEIDNVNFKD